MFWDRTKGDERYAEDSHGVRRRKLNPEFQKLAEKEEELLDQLYEGSTVDSTETPYRYAAYATRIRTLLVSAHRYVAYTSDIGESFRPVSHPWLVRSAYGISWAYILGDVANEGYKQYLENRRVLCPQTTAYRDATSVQSKRAESATGKAQSHHPLPDTLQSTTSTAHPMPWVDPEEDTLTPWNTIKIPISEDYRSVMAERAVFQAIASMGLPALTIHTVVKYSGRALKAAKSTLIRTWAPVGLGLSVVPFLPYVFDKPVEHAVKWSFNHAFRYIGGAEFEPRTEEESQSSIMALEALLRRREERERRKAERQQKVKEE
ncbi:hypothetical protein VTO42DRAFT_1183 [Malbranchea cinnamomea]